MEPASRQKWSEQSSRRRKQPSLYDEYLNQERSAMTQSHPVPQSIIQPTPEVREQHFPQPRSARSDNTIRTVTPDSVVEETTINMEGHVLGSSPRTSLKRDRDSPRSKNCPNQYRKMAESGSVPENDRIRASTGKR